MALGLVLAGFIQGLAGFGSGLVAIGVLVTFYSPYTVVPALLIINLITNSILIYENKKLITKDYFNGNNIINFNSLVCAIFGLVIGANVLIILDTKYVNTILGFLLIIISSYYIIIDLKLINRRFKISSISNNKLVALSSTFISGSLEGFVGLGGPPIVIFMYICKVKKNVFILTFSLFFIILNPFRFILYYNKGLYSLYVIQVTLYILIFIIIGLIFGIIIRRKIVNDKIFSKMVLIILIIIGTNLIRQHLFA